MMDDYEYWDSKEQRKENMENLTPIKQASKWQTFIIYAIAIIIIALAIGYASTRIKASEPAPGVIVLTEIESKQLIEKAQAAETARREFAIAYETICKLRGVKDPAAYDLAPNAEHKELVNLVPKPPTGEKK